MTATTAKTGRVTKLADVKGVMEYRFVPEGWLPPPQAHVMWFEFDPVKHADEYTRVRADLGGRAVRWLAHTNRMWDYRVTWQLHDGDAEYIARVDYHPTERPVLVVIGGL